MIHYQLQCDTAHAFDGWFKDSASFDRQAELGLIVCPSCDSIKVTRALMAPALGRGSRHARDAASAVEPAPAPPPALPGRALPAVAPPPADVSAETQMPDRLRSLLQRLRSEVEKNCDYVGPDFADQARAMHRGEVEPKGIYGETTPVEAEALADEGIEFGVMPWLRRSDS